MASSENQGLQIALIIFVMLTILLSVTTFMFFREYEEADQRSRKDAGSATQAAQQLRDAVTEMELLKKMIGVSDQAKMDDVRASFDKDMKDYAATAPDESKFYRPALEYLANTLNEKTTELIAARIAIQKEQSERETVEKAKQEQVAAAEANARKAEADLAAAKKGFEEERKAKLADEAEMRQQLADKTAAAAEMADNYKKQIDALTSASKKLDYDNASLREKIEVIDPTSGFEVADGKIVWVDQKSRSAFINRGQADGLRRQTMFSVVSGDGDVGSEQKTKGRIEVTEILGPHFAEARITEDKLVDPMVEGDQIYTPLWQPGRAEGFGIIGFIDLDQDGVDDREMVRDLIRLNGGRVDAEDTPEGKQVGELNINTRYVVQGEPPEGKDVLEQAYTKLQRDATQKGVRVISVAKFLDQVGWKNQRQTLKFGRGGNALDVPHTPPDGARRQAAGNVTSGFKVRRPIGSRGLGGPPSENTSKPRTSAYGK